MFRKCLVLVLLTSFCSCGGKYFEQEIFGVKESVWETFSDEERQLVIDVYNKEEEQSQTTGTVDKSLDVVDPFDEGKIYFHEVEDNIAFSKEWRDDSSSNPSDIIDFINHG